MISIPSPSGMGQTVARCPTCKIALWSAYAAAGDDIRFVRACTLDGSDALPPQLHIFTKYKQPWMVLPPSTPSVPEFYLTADWRTNVTMPSSGGSIGRPTQHDYGNAQPTNP